jgi:hypothetical protein
LCLAVFSRLACDAWTAPRGEREWSTPRKRDRQKKTTGIEDNNNLRGGVFISVPW